MAMPARFPGRGAGRPDLGTPPFQTTMSRTSHARLEPPDPTDVPARRADRVALGLALAALALRLALIWWVLETTVLTENLRAGMTLAAEGYLGNPFSAPTGPTAHIAPLYPALVAGAIRVAGDAETGFLLARSVLAVTFSVFIALLPRLAHAMGFTRRVGLAAACVFAPLMPGVFSWIEASGQHETVLTMVALALLVPFTVSAWRRARIGSGRALATGASWGIAAHTSPLLFPVLLTLLACGVAFRLPLRRVALFSAATLLAFGVAVTPWTVRNVRVIGGFSLIRDNFPLELAVSNSASATADMRLNWQPGGSLVAHPYFDTTEAKRMATLGEREYYRQLGVMAKAWIAEHPARFVALTLERVFLFFLPAQGVRYHAYLYVPLLPLFLAGALGFGRREPAVAVSLVLALFAYAAPHFLVQSSSRYSYPVLWIMVLFAAWWVLQVWGRVRAALRTPELERASA